MAFALEEACRTVRLVPRLTTRAKRSHDEEREYDFVSLKEFEAMKERGAFVEYREYEFGMSYGLPRDAIDRTLAAGQSPVVVVNLGRAHHVRAEYPNAFGIFVTVPIEVLKDRLRARAQHSEEQIEERVRNATAEQIDRGLYDLVLVNTSPLEESVMKICDMIGVSVE